MEHLNLVDRFKRGALLAEAKAEHLEEAGIVEDASGIPLSIMTAAKFILTPQEFDELEAWVQAGLTATDEEIELDMLHLFGDEQTEMQA